MQIMLEQMKNIKSQEGGNVVDVITQDNIEMASIMKIQTQQIS
jgi:hypothetical protein